MTLYWNIIGKISYKDGWLEVHSLNPEVRTGWIMTRMEVFRLGLRCMRAAMSAPVPDVYAKRREAVR